MSELRLRLLVLINIELIVSVHLLSTHCHTPLRDYAIRLVLVGIVTHVLKEVEILWVHTLLRLVTGELIHLILLMLLSHFNLIERSVTALHVN